MNRNSANNSFPRTRASANIFVQHPDLTPSLYVYAELERLPLHAPLSMPQQSSGRRSTSEEMEKTEIPPASNTLLMVPTQNIDSKEQPPFPILFIPIIDQQEAFAIKDAFALRPRPRQRERGHLAIAMDIMDGIEAENDESSITGDLQEDINDAEMNAYAYSLEQNLGRLLQPKKKERHYLSIAEDILRDLDEDGEH